MLDNVLNIENQLLQLQLLVTKIRLDVLPQIERMSHVISLMIVVLSILSLLVFILLGKRIVKLITQPINQLVEAMGSIARGEKKLDSRVSIPKQRELADLSHSFNHMLEKLNDARSKIVAQSPAFQRFVPEKGLKLLGKNAITNIELGDFKKYQMAVLFSDIRDFTSTTEKMTARESFDFINNYLIAMEPVIEKNHGFIDKYIGNAVMALFLEEDGAQHAFQACLDMFEALNDINARADELNLENPIRIGICLNSGELILGTIGGEFRMEETVIGDTMNLASRMESTNKAYGTEILISNYSYDLLTEESRSYIREIDKVSVKGKADKILSYEVYEQCDKELKAQKALVADKLKQASDLYDQENYEACMALLKDCQEVAPKDLVIPHYIELVEPHL